MLHRIFLPQLGQTMEEGTIEKWHKKEGDAVKTGEVLYDLATDKATLEVESFADGTVRKILIGEGDRAGQHAGRHPWRAGWRSAGGDAQGGSPQDSSSAGRQGGRGRCGCSGCRGSGQRRAGGARLASPRARKVAKELKVPVAVLRGSGPGGRIIERDVAAYVQKLADAPHTSTARALAFEKGVDLLAVAKAAGGRRVQAEDVEAALKSGTGRPAAPVAGQRLALTAMPRTIAARMTQSKQSVPHFYLFGDLMMGAAMDYVKQLTASSGAKITLTPLLVKAVGLALKKIPRMNARFDRDAIVLNAHCNVGVAVAVEDGLFVPVIRDADQKRLERTSAELRSRVTPRARAS